MPAKELELIRDHPFTHYAPIDIEVPHGAGLQFTLWRTSRNARRQQGISLRITLGNADQQGMRILSAVPGTYVGVPKRKRGANSFRQVARGACGAEQCQMLLPFRVRERGNGTRCAEDRHVMRCQTEKALHRLMNSRGQ